MTAVSVPLSDEIAARLDKLSKQSGRSQADYIREALLEYIGDLEDLALADQRLDDLHAGRSRTTSLEDAIRELGLED